MDNENLNEEANELENGHLAEYAAHKAAATRRTADEIVDQINQSGEFPLDENHTAIDELRTEFVYRLISTIGEKSTKTLLELLRTTNSLVAGGSLLHSLHNDPRSNSVFFYSRRAHDMVDRHYTDAPFPDIDIYVPIQQATHFLNALINRTADSIIDYDATKVKSYKASLYCKSFLQRNGIQQIYNYVIQTDEYQLEFDIMIVRKRTTPLRVVNNFDLTFCQVWFDGAHVYASHPDDVRNKTGTLQGDYVKLFLQGNKFLHQRLGKYKKRGYKIQLDRAAVDEYDGNMDYSYKCLRPEDKEVYRHWTSRALLWWLLGVRNQVTRHSEPLPPGIQHDNILTLPLVSYNNVPVVRTYDMFPDAKLGHTRSNRDGFRNETNEADGYDSEEYEENESLYPIAMEYFNSHREPNELSVIKAHPTEKDQLIQQTLAFYRAANKLLEIVSWPNQYTIQRGDTTGYRGQIIKESLGELLAMKKNRNADPLNISHLRRIPDYYEALRERCIRKSMFSAFVPPSNNNNNNQEDESAEQVFDLHHHPLEAGITQAEMEGYLEQFFAIRDRTRVPCYHRPEARQDHELNCQEPLTMSQVKMIVSDEFYKKWSSPPPQKMGLDQFIEMYDTVLHNTRSHDAVWGDLYHDTICPFCLEPVSRDGGCAYMEHKKEQAEAVTPYCNPKTQIKEIYDKYYAVARAGPDARYGIHIEFCVECGRPCVGHQHFTTQAPYTLVPTPRGAEGQFQYGACTGGGRAELFARILAIRKVYREQKRIDSMEERRLAAIAADDAPNNPDLMAQGRAILAAEQKAWRNQGLPKKKGYTNNAYLNPNGREVEYEGPEAMLEEEKGEREEKEAWVSPPPGQVAEWFWRDTMYYRSDTNGIWAIDPNDNENPVGDWLGVYLPDEDRIDATVPEPDLGESENEYVERQLREQAEPVVNERQRERERIRQAAAAIDVQTVDFHQVPFDVLLRLLPRVAQDAPHREEEHEREYMWRVGQAYKDAHLAAPAAVEEARAAVNQVIQNAQQVENEAEHARNLLENVRRGGRSLRKTHKRRKGIRQRPKTIKHLFRKLK